MIDGAPIPTITTLGSSASIIGIIYVYSYARNAVVARNGVYSSMGGIGDHRVYNAHSGNSSFSVLIQSADITTSLSVWRACCFRVALCVTVR